MKISLTKILFLFLCFITSAHAELKIDQGISKSQAEKKINIFDDRALTPYIAEHTYSFDGDKPNAADSGYKTTSFAWLLNGERYYSRVLSFVVDNEQSEDCLEHSSKCWGINYRHKKCHLFMVNEAGEISGVGRVDIPRDRSLIRGKPFCYQVRGITAPPEVPDSFLLALDYIDSTWSCSNGPMCAGGFEKPDTFQTTVLLHVKKEADETLSLTQDDSCLGRGNRIGNLAVARQKLRACTLQNNKER